MRMVWASTSASAQGLNESPSEKEGKFQNPPPQPPAKNPSMKVPPKRKGNSVSALLLTVFTLPSMKVPPKRKGNSR